MNTIYKTKSQLRAESEQSLKDFLKSGGSVEIVKTKKMPKTKMSSKSSRGFVTGTCGLSNGFPTKTFA